MVRLRNLVSRAGQAIVRFAKRLSGNTYEAAQYSTRRSSVRSTYQSARYDISRTARTKLAEKARYWERNSWLVNKLCDLFETGTVGVGLVIQPASSDQAWNDKAKAWWTGWERLPDLTSLQTFGTLQSLLARTWFIDGEVFVLKTLGDSGMPRIQLLEGHLIRTPAESELDPRWIDGVYTDENGRPAAYGVHAETSSGQYALKAIVPATQMLHVFEPLRPGQYRGISFFSPVLNGLHDLEDLVKLEMQVAKMAGTIGVMRQTQSGTFDPMAYRRSQTTAANITGTGAANTETTQDVIEDVTGAAVIAMREGEDAKQFIASRPSDAQRAHWNIVCKSICIGVGIPYVMVDPDSMQGTVYRGSLDMTALFFQQRFQVIAAACRDIYGYVMSVARNQPALRPPPADYYVCSVFPPRQINVDVGHSSDAALKSLAAGTDNYDTLLSARGLNWKDTLRAKAEQAAYLHELADKYGVSISEISTTAPQQVPQQPQQKDDDI